MTLPELFAVAHGQTCSGAHRCVFCGSPAETLYTLPDSFTTRDTLAAPRSQFVCRGCILCLEEAGEAAYHTGEKYQFTKAFRRMCSWVVTRSGVIAATKAHIAYLRGVLADPPEPPFAVSVAVSGQKQILYRGVVCHSRESVCVTLEGERVNYRPTDLISRLELCGKIVSATGKPALAEPVSQSVYWRVCERFADGEELCEAWNRCRNEPLSRLAAFLSPAKEECERVYPSDRCVAGDGPGPISARGRGAGRPQPASNRGGRDGRNQGTRVATLFGDV